MFHLTMLRTGGSDIFDANESYIKLINLVYDMFFLNQTNQNFNRNTKKRKIKRFVVFYL